MCRFMVVLILGLSWTIYASARASTCPASGPWNHGQITNIESDGVIDIADATGLRRLRLAAVMPFPGRPGRTAYVRALGTLTGAEVEFAEDDGNTDRNGARAGEIRIIAFGTAGDTASLTDAMLAEGAALLRATLPLPCRDAGIDAEARARDAHLGEWARTGWPLDGAAVDIVAAGPDFMVVWAQVRSVSNRDYRSYINLGEDHTTSLTIVVPDTLRDHMGGADGLSALRFHWIEARGYLTLDRGPTITLEGPSALRLLRSAEKNTWQTQHSTQKRVTRHFDGTPPASASAPAAPDDQVQ